VIAPPVPRYSIQLIVPDGGKPSEILDGLAVAGYRVSDIDGPKFAALGATEADQQPEEQQEIALLVIDERSDAVAQAA